LQLRKSAIVLIICFIVVFGLLYFASAEQSLVSASDARELIAAHKDSADFIVIDLRTRGEYAEGHIEGARLIDYYATNFQRMVSLLDRNATILLYCQRGRQSSMAFRALEKLGFGKVLILDGGVAAWTEAGYPLVKP